MSISAQLAAALRTDEYERSDRVELWSVATGLKLADFEAEAVSVKDDGDQYSTCDVSGGSFAGLIPTSVVSGTNRNYGDGTEGSGTYGGSARRSLRGFLLPAKTEARLFYDAQLPDGTVETVAQGRYVVSEVEWADDGTDEPPVSFSGGDALRRLSLASYVQPFTRKGITFGQAITELIHDALPSITVLVTTPTTELIGRVVFGTGDNDNRLDDLRSLAQGAGWRVRMDGDGAVVVEPIPTVLGAPVWSFDDGEQGVNVALTMKLSDEDLYNGVRVRIDRGEAAPIIATVIDTTGAYSPTEIGITKLLPISPAGVSTQGQAQAAGVAELAKSGGIVERYEITSLHLPHLRPGAVVRVRSERLGVDFTTVLDARSFGFAHNQDTTVSVVRRG